jgi:hypothetical protein
MTRDEARTLIRANTDHEGSADTQITTTQLNAWIDIENKLLAREVALVAPSLYTLADEEQELVASDDDESLLIPDDFEHLVRVEKQAGSIWYPLEISDELNVHTGSRLTAREEEGVITLSPQAMCTGTYRIIYVRTPLTLDNDVENLDVPAGCEDIVCERVCARVRTKLDEDPSVHIANAERVWGVQKKALRRRYGKSPQTGLRKVKFW